MRYEEERTLIIAEHGWDTILLHPISGDLFTPEIRAKVINTQIDKAAKRNFQIDENQVETPSVASDASSSDSATQNANDPFGRSFPEFTGKPMEAIDHLLQTKSGYVPGAFYKEGLGPIDLSWERLNHIITRRNQQGLNGIEFAKEIPAIISQGSIENDPSDKDTKLIRDGKNRAVIALTWQKETTTWLVTAYPENKGNQSPDSNTPLNQAYDDGQNPPPNFETKNTLNSPPPFVNDLNDANAGKDANAASKALRDNIIQLRDGWRVEVEKFNAKLTEEARIKDYRSYPADLQTVCEYAWSVAKRDNKKMIVNPSNSYGHFIYRVNYPDSYKQEPTPGAIKCWVIYPDGAVYSGIITNDKVKEEEAKKNDEKSASDKKINDLIAAAGGLVTREEVEEQEENRWSFVGDVENYLDSGWDREKIFDFFDNELKQIATVPTAYLSQFAVKPSDPRVYCSQAYFVNHGVNHHPDVNPEEYKRIQDALNSPDEVIRDNRNGKDALVFVKRINGTRGLVVEVQAGEDGKIALYKTWMPTHKKPYPRLPRVAPTPVGGETSTIDTSDNSESGGNLSTLDVGKDSLSVDPPFVNDLNDIIAGKYSDRIKVDQLLDETAEEAEKAGLMEEYDALFQEAADYLTKLLQEEARKNQ